MHCSRRCPRHLAHVLLFTSLPPLVPAFGATCTKGATATTCRPPHAPRFLSRALSSTSAASSFSPPHLLRGSRQFKSRDQLMVTSPTKQAPSHALSTPSLGSPADESSVGLQGFAMGVKKALDVFWRFSRPHTIYGTITSVLALHLSMIPSDIGLMYAFDSQFLKMVSHAMISALFINVYIVGLNQVTDVEIDKVNKPDLPIAKGDLSMKAGIATILTCLVAGITIGFLPGLTSAALQATLLGSAILGTLYSLPPFRLKRFPTSAAICISAVRGFVINWGFAAHAFLSLSAANLISSQTTSMFPPQVQLVALFYTVYGVVIALAKDVPDVKGDKGAGIRSFSVRMGQGKVLALAQWMLSAVHYLAAGILAYAAMLGNPLQRSLAALCAILLGESVRRQREGIDAADPAESYRYYMHLWKMFYLSYFILPFIR